ncbi:MAG: T9SS type A sorting domain-containing protein [Cytophagales bacterium]|nr:T9SS type A sorting domain-containing protein [Cytophagales bacterium]
MDRFSVGKFFSGGSGRRGFWVIIWFALFLGFFEGTSVSAQVSVGGSPYSFNHVSVLPPSPVEEMSPFALESAFLSGSESGRVAHEFSSREYDIYSSGLWHVLPSGDRVWRLSIRSRDALSLYLVYSRFHLPPGGILHVYDRSRIRVLGGFTEANNRGSFESPGVYASAPLRGDYLTLEYYEPKAQIGKTQLRIGRVGHVYKDLGTTQVSQQYQSLYDLGDAQKECSIDINCSVASGWRNQRRSVGYMLFEGVGCTVVLLNNTERNGALFGLTGYSCLSIPPGSRSVPNLASAMFFWGRETPAERCGFVWQTGALQSFIELHQRVGVGAVFDTSFKGLNTVLFHLNENPIRFNRPYRLYFSGWTSNNTFPEEGDRFFTIMHPAGGDVKKIGFLDYQGLGKLDGNLDRIFNVALASLDDPRDPDEATHYRFEIQNTGSTGVLEGWSVLGGPVYDGQRLITGVLSSGVTLEGSCDVETDTGMGRLFSAWDDPLDTDSRGLKRYLVRSVRQQNVIRTLKGMDVCEVEDKYLSPRDLPKIREVCRPATLLFRITDIQESSFSLAVALDETADEVHWVLQGEDYTVIPGYEDIIEGRDGRGRKASSGSLKEVGLIPEHERIEFELSTSDPIEYPEDQDPILILFYRNQETGLYSRLNVNPFNTADYEVPSPSEIELVDVSSTSVRFNLQHPRGGQASWVILPSYFKPIFTLSSAREYADVPKGGTRLGAGVKTLQGVENLDPFTKYFVYSGISTDHAGRKDVDSELSLKEFSTHLPATDDFAVNLSVKQVTEEETTLLVNSYEGGVLYWVLVPEDVAFQVPEDSRDIRDSPFELKGIGRGVIVFTDYTVKIKGYNINRPYHLYYTVVSPLRSSAVKRNSFVVYGRDQIAIEVQDSRDDRVSLRVNSPASGYIRWITYHKSRLRIPTTLKDLQTVSVRLKSHKDSLRVRAGQDYTIDIGGLVSSEDYVFYYHIESSGISENPPISAFVYRSDAVHGVGSGGGILSRQDGSFIYPNPVLGEKVWLRFPEPIERVRLYSLYGELLLDQEDYPIQSLDISGLPSGVYIAEIFYDEGRSSARSRIIRRI